MPTIHNEVQKDQLALHLASGGGVADWAGAHGIPERTAYTWSRSPEVRDRTESIRRAVLADAVQQLGAHAAAAGQIVKLAEDAQIEAVRLQAARAVLAEFVSASNDTGMDGRLADIEQLSVVRGPLWELPLRRDLVGLALMPRPLGVSLRHPRQRTTDHGQPTMDKAGGTTDTAGPGRSPKLTVRRREAPIRGRGRTSGRGLQPCIPHSPVASWNSWPVSCRSRRRSRSRLWTTGVASGPAGGSAVRGICRR
jgi:hypothetical protein